MTWPDDDPIPQPLDVEAFLSRIPPEEDSGRRHRQALIEEEVSPLGQPLPDRGVRAGGYHGAWRTADRLPIGEVMFADLLKDLLGDGVLVDLGGGRGLLAPALRDEAQIPIKHYVNIDVIVRAEQHTSQGVGYSLRGPDVQIQGDVLDVLERIPDGSDEAVPVKVKAMAAHGLIVSEQKAQAIAEEAARILPVGGIFFALESPKILELAMASGRFEKLFPPGDRPPIIIRKIA